MGKIHFLPIEPLEERYSAQWLAWFQDAFERRGIEYRTYHGEALTDRIVTGQFLDVHSTNHYKLTQLAAVVKAAQKGELRDGDVVFVEDLWFPGIEALAYIRDATRARWRIAGILHAGTWDPWDYLSQCEMGRWAEALERSFVQVADLVMVATEFHAGLLASRAPRRVAVTGLPVKMDSVRRRLDWRSKERLVVFPHRRAHEKMTSTFRRLGPVMAERFGCTCIAAMDVWNGSKDAYYRLLARAKVAVSFGWQETFGIAMLEASALGAVPVAPRRLSYEETLPLEWLFESEDEALELVRVALDAKVTVHNPYENAEEVIVDHLQELAQ